MKIENRVGRNERKGKAREGRTRGQNRELKAVSLQGETVSSSKRNIQDCLLQRMKKIQNSC